MSEENVSLPVAQALASALEKIEAYVPTEYVDNSEPDIDAEHLNHAEQGIMRVTNLLNAAVDVIQGQESRISDAETKIGTAALTGGMTDLSSGVNSLYSNLGQYLYSVLQTAEIAGDTDVDIDFSSIVPSGKHILFIVPVATTPISTWSTTLTVKMLSENYYSNRKLPCKTLGSTAQSYMISFLVCYSDAAY